MRRDMPRVIVDEPRVGMRRKHFRGRERQLLRFDPDRLRRHEGMNRSWRKWCHARTFGDHLSPLGRWLEKNCGRPWDDVRSEIAAVARKDTLRGYHMWQHVLEFVTERPLIVDGDVMSTEEMSWRSTRFFVDPESGRLRENPGW